MLINTSGGGYANVLGHAGGRAGDPKDYGFVLVAMIGELLVTHGELVWLSNPMGKAATIAKTMAVE